ncbi:MAG TPA: long-chain fatty acid--CoA ligase [Deltaproteobacteria bacterium]|nr:long-chain fatty acid--CoA ligase [Deltaproteobacteria bacterium]HCP46124.1 long-chain fatty acid--CoA ligase [Deltaproteobacteria bacterium]
MASATLQCEAEGRDQGPVSSCRRPPSAQLMRAIARSPYPGKKSQQDDGPSSVGQMLFEAVQRWGPQIALRRRREPLKWSVTTWTELGQQVRSLGAGLLSLGVEPGDRVALLSKTRLEWSLVDYAALSIGAATVPIYHSSTASQVEFVLRDSGARVLVIEDRGLLTTLRPHLEDLPALESIVVMEVMDLRQEPNSMLLDELKREGRRLLREQEGCLEEALAAVEPDSLATIVYTSGTTGSQKGVRLSHRNLMAAVSALHGVLDVGPDDTTLLCLPLSHIFPRLAQFAALTYGFCIAYARRVDQLQEVLLEVRPTFFFAVPRLYERMYHQVAQAYRDLPPLLQTVVKKGIAATREQKGEALVDRPSARGPRKIGRRLSNLVHGRVAERTLFDGVREALGGRVRFCVSGGAPLNEEVARFFRLAGVEILEGYGLTEGVGAATLNPPSENRLGTVGRPLPGIRIRIASDGEVLLGGDVVFQGYHNQADETAMALDDDGWLHTGDVGSLDEAGYLVITDRKKDILITSGGKNVAPQRVESALRMSPYFSDAMVFGDRRPFLVALVTLDEDELSGLAESLDLPVDDGSQLRRDPRVRELLDGELERCNARLAHYERVRRFRVLPRSLSIEGGTLTPTLKVRRRAVFERNRPLIEGMYEGLPPA